MALYSFLLKSNPLPPKSPSAVWPHLRSNRNGYAVPCVCGRIRFASWLRGPYPPGRDARCRSPTGVHRHHRAESANTPDRVVFRSRENLLHIKFDPEVALNNELFSVKLDKRVETVIPVHSLQFITG